MEPSPLISNIQQALTVGMGGNSDNNLGDAIERESGDDFTVPSMENDLLDAAVILSKRINSAENTFQWFIANHKHEAVQKFQSTVANGAQNVTRKEDNLSKITTSYIEVLLAIADAAKVSEAAGKYIASVGKFLAYYAKNKLQNAECIAYTSREITRVPPMCQLADELMKAVCDHIIVIYFTCLSV